MKLKHQLWFNKQPKNKQDWLDLQMKNQAIWLNKDMLTSFTFGVVIGILVGFLF